MELTVNSAHGMRQYERSPEYVNIFAEGESLIKISTLIANANQMRTARANGIAALINKLSIAGRSLTYVGFVGEGMSEDAAFTMLFPAEIAENEEFTLSKLSKELPSNEKLRDDRRHRSHQPKETPEAITIDSGRTAFYPITYGYNMSWLASSMAKAYLNSEQTVEHSAWWQPMLKRSYGVLGHVNNEYALPIDNVQNREIRALDNKEDRVSFDIGRVSVGFATLESIKHDNALDATNVSLGDELRIDGREIRFEITERSDDGHIAQTTQIYIGFSEGLRPRSSLHLLDFQVIESQIYIGNTSVCAETTKILPSNVNKKLNRLARLFEIVAHNPIEETTQ